MERNPSNLTLFTGGLHPNTTELDLSLLIEEKLGIVPSTIRIPKKKGKVQRSKCIAFLDFECQKDVELVINYFKDNRVYMNDRHISFAYSNCSSIEKKKNLRLFMSPIPNHIKDHHIERELLKRGFELRSAYKIKGKDNVPRGFGYIEFYNEDHAKILLEEGFLIVNGTRIEVEDFKPKNDNQTKTKIKLKKKNTSNKKWENYNYKKYHYKNYDSSKRHHYSLDHKTFYLNKKKEHNCQGDYKSQNKTNYLNYEEREREVYLTQEKGESYFVPPETEEKLPLLSLKNIMLKNSGSFNLYGELEVFRYKDTEEELYQEKIGKIFDWKNAKKWIFRDYVGKEIDCFEDNYRFNKIKRRE